MNAAMSFEEAMLRAKAAHVVVESFRQPGNDYALEYRCSCGGGMFGTIFAKSWDQHILDAADELLAAASTRDGLAACELEQ